MRGGPDPAGGWPEVWLAWAREELYEAVWSKTLKALAQERLKR
jgi:hypothetical protein